MSRPAPAPRSFAPLALPAARKREVRLPVSLDAVAQPLSLTTVPAPSRLMPGSELTGTGPSNTPRMYGAASPFANAYPRAPRGHLDHACDAALITGFRGTRASINPGFLVHSPDEAHPLHSSCLSEHERGWSAFHAGAGRHRPPNLREAAAAVLLISCVIVAHGVVEGKHRLRA